MDKSLSFSWELMFTKSMFNHDMLSQSLILNQVADLIDSGIIQLTVTETLNFPLEDLRAAHKKVEDGIVIGKITLDMKDWA
ncbi:hypothetical protein K7432_012854 [Basidiobolus ranarum]|uniref:Uncharacterized protein n=1 Tax=Basidiobolus ranarum TaxID=34480 RepID=A0ABR2WKB2_9FUNG